MSGSAESPLHIVGMGAQTPIGLEPSAVAAAVRAGVCRFQEYAWLPRKSDGSAIVASLLSTMDPRWSAHERMRHLGIASATQALAPLLDRAVWPSRTPLPMMISVPPLRPGMQSDDAAQLAREIMTALPIPPDQKHSGLFATGQEGGLAALVGAAGLIEQRKAEVCLVGGVDSFRDLEVLHWLEDTHALKSEDVPTGRIPGEGAAFLLVCGRSWLRQSNPLSRGLVTVPARTMEPNPWYMGRPCLGEGLTRAVRMATDAGLPPRMRADTTWCDLNGESWRADEWSLAYLRTVERHGEPLRLRHPADVLGEMGAATGTMLVMLAALDVAHPRSKAQSALVFAASDTRPHRAACVVLKGGQRS